ncbi:lipid IV(A) 3-deoxy-D-manno-octulosonic acid transferase [Porticoccus sp.]|uniref:lipid IV(A) 3-deoxy-D-manno-octulosonic acid transferase n=1 Tax=Porticoccus sp. TaxID=2024853 RepID=UPI003F696A47
MARFFYSVLFYLLTPLILLRLLWRGARAPEYRRRWPERFGFVPGVDQTQTAKTIWVHSVSLGETLASVPMIRRLQQRYPEAQLVVTTMTPTGSACVKNSFGDTVYHVYAPYDLPCAVKRFLQRVRPDLLIIMETELWPNLIHGCAERNIHIVLANARLSEKSARGYRRFAALTGPMLQCINTVAAQHEEDGQRFLLLGLPAPQLLVTGNIKFDLTLDEPLRARAAQLRTQWQAGSQRPILLVASTHRGEDDILLDAFEQIRQQFPALLLVLVPRHPERFDDVVKRCLARGLNTVRRSGGTSPATTDQVLVGDTMGELLVFFGACDIAFIGGSLVPTGGHNLIEPAVWQVPVLSGPHLFNFADVSRLLLAAGGMAICKDARSIADNVVVLLGDPDAAARMGAAAKTVAEKNRGALDRLLTVIER